MIPNITSKNNDSLELKIVETVTALCLKYDLPTFTQTIVVEKGAIPHSHPVLTLNTRVTDERLILQMFVHEQLHWHAQERPQYKECIAYLKTKYQDDGEHNKSGTYPDSYWEHIIVCFNTRTYLESVLPKEDIEWIYAQWQAYPMLEKVVIERKDEIQTDLVKFDSILY